MTKEALRQTYKAKRLAIPGLERLKLDDLILLQFQQLNWFGINNVLTYWPISAMAEPNMHLFNGYLRHFVPNLQLCYPVCNWQNATMQAIAINDDTVYLTNKYGITEPKEGEIVSPAVFDLVFVPLLVADKQGYRVGYGKGFYDKFLSNTSTNTVLVGISYFEPIDAISDVNEFDIPLDLLITPNSIHEFQ